jgi:hypothetical protein
MIDCAAIGDSIATGYGPVLGCEVRAAVGLSSSRIINLAPGQWHKYCVISAGSNDPQNPKLADNLRHIRNQSQCKFWIWVEPVNGRAASIVASVASEHNDYVVSFTPGGDHVHPASYGALAGSILQTTGN